MHSLKHSLPVAGILELLDEAIDDLIILPQYPKLSKPDESNSY